MHTLHNKNLSGIHTLSSSNSEMNPATFEQTLYLGINIHKYRIMIE